MGNLCSLLKLKLLAQQYQTKDDDICDILAKNKQNQLVIIELKNREDRHIISQLTRYYDSLIKENPFIEDIDYNLPVKLMAIAPRYHRHNLIDVEYSRLDFQLLEFKLQPRDNKIFFTLQSLKEDVIAEQPILYNPVIFEPTENLPDLPPKLETWLGFCEPEEQQGILTIRKRVLECNPKMKEIVEGNWIYYRTTKNKIAAEISFGRKSQKPILFVHFKTKIVNNLGITYKKTRILRFRIYPKSKEIIGRAHVKEGLHPKGPKREIEAGWHINWTRLAERDLQEGSTVWDLLGDWVVERFEEVKFEENLDNNQ